VPADTSWEGYPEGSSQAGTIKITDYSDSDGQKGIHALVLVEIQMTCGACVTAAQELPNKLSQSWNDLGIKVIHLVVTDTSGAAGTVQAALQWKDNFAATWAVAADPTFTFAKQGTNYMPVQVLVDPRTLEVRKRKEGYDGAFTEAEQLAANNSK